MIILFLSGLGAAAASPNTVVDAERAYARSAQESGQWTAFRANAAEGAIMFVPDPVDAVKWLNGRPDPKVAVKWQPAAAFVSCDGRTGATTGPWQRPTSVGYYATVWSRNSGRWRWNVDFGDRLDSALPPAPLKVPLRRASCRTANPERLPPLVPAKKSDVGSSTDHSLEWQWWLEQNGARHFLVYLWNGKTYDLVIDKNGRP